MQRRILRDTGLLHPVLFRKTEAVRRDVDGHLPEGYRLWYFETWRDPKVQAQLVAEGVSKTHHSRHSAVDAHGRPCAWTADLQFQQDLGGRKGWRYVSWQDTPAEWIAWLDSAKKAHHLLRKGLTWDHPHCELASEDAE